MVKKIINHSLYSPSYIIDIALISEKYFTSYYFLHLPGFRLHQTNHPTAHGGVAICVISSHTLHRLPPLFQTDYLQSCAVSLLVDNKLLSTITINNCPLNIIYLLTNTPFYFFVPLDQPIVGGGINSKHTQFGCRVTNP